MIYTEKDLRYSATARCLCGLGLAYPKEHFKYPVDGYWNCSGIWMYTANLSIKHTDKLPWVFYEIRSEDESPNEPYSTRPVKHAEEEEDK